MLKKREYDQQVRDIERGVFTPIVFTTTGGMGHEMTTFYKRLADMIAEALLYRDGMDEMLFILCHSALSHHVCSRQQVLPPLPCACTGHNPRNS